MIAAFQPSRYEVREIQRLARECEIDARVTQQLGHCWYGAHRAAARSDQAFALAAKVSARGQGGVL